MQIPDGHLEMKKKNKQTSQPEGANVCGCNNWFLWKHVFSKNAGHTEWKNLAEA